MDISIGSRQPAVSQTAPLGLAYLMLCPVLVGQQAQCAGVFPALTGQLRSWMPAKVICGNFS